LRLDYLLALQQLRLDLDVADVSLLEQHTTSCRILP
jgi:hypothetical protein